MKSKKIVKSNRTNIFYIFLIIILIFVSTALSLYIYFSKTSDDNKSNKNSSKSYISLNLLQFSIIDKKAIKRTDNSIQEIEKFLENESANSRCGASGSEGPGYFSVRAWTKNEDQLLLGYGCNDVGAQMYAIKTNDKWATISPTNQFDNFGIPGCDYLSQNNISAEIAPVCANGYNSTNGVIVASPKYLNR